MTETRSNLAISVAARLLNRARQAGDDYQVLLTSFCFERFLYRLGVSQVRDRFVLKGAGPHRPISDPPLTGKIDLRSLPQSCGKTSP